MSRFFTHQGRPLQCTPSCHMHKHSGYTLLGSLLHPHTSHPPGHILQGSQPKQIHKNISVWTSYTQACKFIQVCVCVCVECDATLGFSALQSIFTFSARLWTLTYICYFCSAFSCCWDPALNVGKQLLFLLKQSRIKKPGPYVHYCCCKRVIHSLFC